MAEPIAVYELVIPLVDNRPPLNANQRLHWREKAERVCVIRGAVHVRCKEAGLVDGIIHAARHVTVEIHYRPNDKRIRDASNLNPTQKAAVDGLVQAGVIPGDDGRYVFERQPVIEQGDGPRRLWLRVEIDR
jgi:crossover junction endodeoxyribonuclease RusA